MKDAIFECSDQDDVKVASILIGFYLHVKKFNMNFYSRKYYDITCQGLRNFWIKRPTRVLFRMVGLIPAPTCLVDVTDIYFMVTAYVVPDVHSYKILI